MRFLSLLNFVFPIERTIKEPNFANWSCVVWISVTIVGGLITLWLYYRNLRACKKWLESIYHALIEYRSQDTKDYNRLSSQMTSLAGQPWKEYERTLIRKLDVDGNIRLYSTVEARLFFNDALVNTRLNLNLYASIPGIFTGFGILGTFFGLTVGLGQLNFSHEVESLRRGIEGLLGGMGVAFTSSLWGILFSIIILFAQRFSLKRLYDLVTSIQNELDSLFPPLPGEQVLLDCLWESQQQSRELKRFNEDLAISIATALDEKLANRLTLTTNEIVAMFKEFSGELRNTFQALRNSIDALSNKGTEVLGITISSQISDNIEEFKRVFAAVTDEIRLSAERFSGAHKNLAEDLVQLSENMIEKIDLSFSEVASRQMQIAEKLETTAQSLVEQLQAWAGDAVSLWSKQASEISNIVKNLASGVGMQTKEIIRRLSLISEDYSEQHKIFTMECQALEALVKELKEAVNLIEKSIRPLNESLSKLEAGIDQLTTAQKLMAGVVEQNQNELREYMGQTRSVLEQLKATSEEIRATWKEYENVFTVVRQDLEGIMNHLHDGLRRYAELTSEHMNQFAQDVEGYTARVVEYFFGALENLQDQIGELENTIERLGTSLTYAQQK